MTQEIRPFVNPPVMPGLYFWLDAQDPTTMTLIDGKISIWNDKSANNFNWAQSNAANRPIYDPNLFDGNGGVIFDFLKGTGVLSVNPASGISINKFTYFLVGARTDGKLAAVLQDFGSGAILGPTNYNDRFGIGQAAQTLEGIPMRQLTIMGFKNTGVPATSFFFSHKNEKYFPISGGVPGSTSTMSNLSFGGKDFGENNGYSMNCVSVLMYNRVLTDGEINSVNNWLVSQYRVPTLTNQRNIVFSGDSITAGFFSDRGVAYPEIAMNLLGITPNNFLVSAIPGQVVWQADVSDKNLVDNLLDKKIITILIGANDLNVLGVDVELFKMQLLTYCLNRKEAGWRKVLVSTMLPRFGSPNTNFNVDRNGFNSWLRLNYQDFSDGLIDIASDLLMGVDVAATNTTLYYDGVHPTAIGHKLLAPYFANAMRSFV